MLLFVTLKKEGMDATHQYEDKFLSADIFHWESQNRNTQESSIGQELKNPQLPKHLFVRKTAKIRHKTQPFRYAGLLNFQRWEGEKPIKVRLLFEPKLAVYITERQWHPSQEFHMQRDGCVGMRFETTGRKQVVRWILSWMPDVKVLAPKSLRDRVREKLLDGLRSQD